jgi:hypothetical protein
MTMQEIKPYSLYVLSTGIFTGVVRTTGRRKEDLPVPAGYGFAEGSYDHLSQRLDLATGQVVDYQPPRPDDDHEWTETDADGTPLRRWTLKPKVAERRARKAAASARIAELAAKEGRAIREHLLGIVPTEEDRAAGAMTLQEIHDEITSLRTEVR